MHNWVNNNNNINKLYYLFVKFCNYCYLLTLCFTKLSTYRIATVKSINIYTYIEISSVVLEKKS